MMKNRLDLALRIVFVALVVATGAVKSPAQQGSDGDSPASDARNAELEQHIDMLSSKIDSMQQQLQESHNEMEAMRAELGISDGLVRISVGIESAADLIAELDAALG